MPIKTKISLNRRYVILALVISGILLVTLGSFFPIAKANPGVCTRGVLRLGLIKGELGQFLDIKQQEINRDKVRKDIGIQLGCAAGNRAELYIF